MQPDPAKFIFLAYTQPGRTITALLIAGVFLFGFYIHVGETTFLLWVVLGGIVIGLVQAIRQLFDRGPCIIVNEEGVNDKRLGMGVIRWSDIQRVRMQNFSGAHFISLDLSNSEQYRSKQPAYTRIANQIWRLFHISPINIKAGYMDVTPEELYEVILSEVELSRSRS